MKRIIPVLLLALIILIAVDNLAWANKFTKIGGGLAGSSDDKIEFLKSMRGIFGSFLVILGVLSFATRARFEGLIGMVTGKTFEAVTVVPVILIILGSLLILSHIF